jgi:hypothetical protein
MNSNTIASMMSGSLADRASQGNEGVVEIGLLLPTNRAAALLKLAQERHESVGQVLRKLIDRELSEPE